jgi:adenine/guanine phosphoribosyltransferase-like PRPP-binding protein
VSTPENALLPTPRTVPMAKAIDVEEHHHLPNEALQLRVRRQDDPSVAVNVSLTRWEKHGPGEWHVNNITPHHEHWLQGIGSGGYAAMRGKFGPTHMRELTRHLRERYGVTKLDGTRVTGARAQANKVENTTAVALTKAVIKLRSSVHVERPVESRASMAPDDWHHDGTLENPLNPAKRVVRAGDAMGTYKVQNHGVKSNHAYVEEVQSVTRGGGRAAMQHLIDRADRHGVSLSLYANPLKPQGEGKKMSTRELKSWYRGFGFRPQQGDLMVRTPAPALRKAATATAPGFRIEHVASYYETPGARELAHRAKAGDPDSIHQMAQEMAAHVPAQATLVPVPGRTGQAGFTLSLAHAIAAKTGATVADALRGTSRESLYHLKKTGQPLPDLGLTLTTPLKGHVIAIDNVAATGHTARAVHSLLPEARFLVHSIDHTASDDPTVAKSLTKSWAESGDKPGTSAWSVRPYTPMNEIGKKKGPNSVQHARITAPGQPGAIMSYKHNPKSGHTEIINFRAYRYHNDAYAAAEQVMKHGGRGIDVDNAMMYHRSNVGMIGAGGVRAAARFLRETVGSKTVGGTRVTGTRVNNENDLPKAPARRVGEMESLPGVKVKRALERALLAATLAKAKAFWEKEDDDPRETKISPSVKRAALKKFGKWSAVAAAWAVKKQKSKGKTLEKARRVGFDKGEPDFEGGMAKSQLRRAEEYAKALNAMLKDGDELPAWVQDKISKASEYLDAAYHFLDYQTNGKK